MNRLPLALCGLLLPFLGCVGSPASAEEPRAATDVVATLAADGRFEVFTGALERAGLVETLRGEGPFTVFAPTDKAFAALPEEVAAALLRPQSEAELARLLEAHVVAGRVESSDLLKVKRLKTLAGAGFDVGLRIGAATITQPDIPCTNGIVHVIDAVLQPPPRRRVRSLDPEVMIRSAIEMGAPLYNAGNIAGCAAVYQAVAKRLVDAGRDTLTDLALWDLGRPVAAPAEDATQQAWALRHAFDRILAGLAFEPPTVAGLPKGFPQPGPLGRVLERKYPGHRAARAETLGADEALAALRGHFEKSKIAMTAPLEVTLDAKMRMTAAAISYRLRTEGSTGAQGAVEIVDVDPVTVLSIGMPGPRGDKVLEVVKLVLEARMKALSLEAAGPWRVLVYDSPLVEPGQRYWEMH